METLISLLDYVKEEQRRGLWVAPFGEVAAYFRAQKILENAVPRNSADVTRLSWDLPQWFPPGVVLKARLRQGSRCRLFQRGRELHPKQQGVYSVSFDARELVIRSGM